MQQLVTMPMLLITFWLFAFNHSAFATEKIFWEGKVDQLQVRWTDMDITATDTRTGRLLFSANSLAKKDFAALQADSDEETSCEYERIFVLLAVVGKMASFKDSEYVFCQGTAHPSITIKFTVIDLTKPNQQLQLTDIFPQTHLLSALLSEPVLKKALAKAKVSKSPSNLTQLTEILANQELEAKATEKEFYECSFILTENWLTNFAVHHLKDKQVAIRLGLEPAAGACRGGFSQLGFYLPIPTAWKTALANAKTGNAGFLMERAVKGHPQTKIVLTH